MSIGSIREKGLFAEGGQGRNRVVLQVFNTLSMGMCIFRCWSNPAHLSHKLNLEKIHQGWLSCLPLML